MEALTAASVAALTVYDMCKAVDRGMHIDGLRVTHKAGGKSGAFSSRSCCDHCSAAGSRDHGHRDAFGCRGVRPIHRRDG